MNRYLLFALLALVSIACVAADEAPSLATSQQDFGFRTLTALSTAKPKQNVFISPLSIQMALAMTANGAEGATKTAMLETLGVQDLTLAQLNTAGQGLLSGLQRADAGLTVNIANAIWFDNALTPKEEFLQRVRTSYLAEASKISMRDPATPGVVNTWVKDKTKGMIPTIVDANALRDTLMLLVNAVYFKGKWASTFESKATQDGPFTTAAGTKITLPMMHQQKFFKYAETLAYQAVALPYEKSSMRMVVILPKAGKTPDDLLAAPRADWSVLTKSLEYRTVNLTLPRFAAGFETSLNDTLKALGMGIAFDGAKADFSAMAKEPLCIGGVIHKSRLTVSEEGTEAAAVTAVMMVGTSMPTNIAQMVVDRPFLLVIDDDNTGIPLFMGVINAPEKAPEK